MVDGGAPDIDAVQQTIVYLTADAEDELMELKASETYIIGGICDHNRYKVSDYHLPTHILLRSLIPAPDYLESLSEQSQSIRYPNCTASHWSLSRQSADTQGAHCQSSV